VDIPEHRPTDGEHPPDDERKVPAEGKTEIGGPTRPSRLKLSLAVVPLVALTIAGWLGTAIRPNLIAHHPLGLLIYDPRTFHMVLVGTRVSLLAFVFVVIIRRLLFDPCYFMLGRWYGDAAVRWLEKRSPEIGTLAASVERWFPRWGRLLVFFHPAPVVMVVAGASKMSFKAFMFYDFLGTALVVVLARRFGWILEPVAKPVTGFITRQQVPLIAISVALVVFTIWNSRRNGHSMTSISDVEADLKEEADKDH